MRPRAVSFSVFDVATIEVGECRRVEGARVWSTVVRLRGGPAGGLCITILNDKPTIRLNAPGSDPVTLGEEWPHAYEMTVDEVLVDRLLVRFGPGGEPTQDWPGDAAVGAWLSEQHGRPIVACSLTMESTVRDDRCEYDFWDATCKNCHDEGTVEERTDVDASREVPCAECEAGARVLAARVADDESRAEAMAEDERRAW